MDGISKLAGAAWILLFSALTACVLPQQTAPYVSLIGVWMRCAWNCARFQQLASFGLELGKLENSEAIKPIKRCSLSAIGAGLC